MIRFYFHPTPNPAKVALLLEETGLFLGSPADRPEFCLDEATKRALFPSNYPSAA